MGSRKLAGPSTPSCATIRAMSETGGALPSAERLRNRPCGWQPSRRLARRDHAHRPGDAADRRRSRLLGNGVPGARWIRHRGPLRGSLLQSPRRSPVLRPRNHRERRRESRNAPSRRAWPRTRIRSSSSSSHVADPYRSASRSGRTGCAERPSPRSSHGCGKRSRTCLTAPSLLLDWARDELDPKLPPAVAFAGSKHLVIAVGSLGTLGRLAYPFDAMKALMLEADLTTLQLVWRESPGRFRARDPFPVGNAVEDPATGAAAAAFGAYLRSRGEIHPPARFTIDQGVEMGRPSLLEVEVRRRSAGYGSPAPPCRCSASRINRGGRRPPWQAPRGTDGPDGWRSNPHPRRRRRA